YQASVAVKRNPERKAFNNRAWNLGASQRNLELFEAEILIGNTTSLVSRARRPARLPSCALTATWQKSFARSRQTARCFRICAECARTTAPRNSGSVARVSVSRAYRCIRIATPGRSERRGQGIPNGSHRRHWVTTARPSTAPTRATRRLNCRRWVNTNGVGRRSRKEWNLWRGSSTHKETPCTTTPSTCWRLCIIFRESFHRTY